MTYINFISPKSDFHYLKVCEFQKVMVDYKMSEKRDKRVDNELHSLRERRNAIKDKIDEVMRPFRDEYPFAFERAFPSRDSPSRLIFPTVNEELYLIREMNQNMKEFKNIHGRYMLAVAHLEQSGLKAAYKEVCDKIIDLECEFLYS